MNNATTKCIDEVGPVSLLYVDHAGPPNHRHREKTQPEATAAGQQHTMMTGRVEDADKRVLGCGRVDEQDDQAETFDFVRNGAPTTVAGHHNRLVSQCSLPQDWTAQPAKTVCGTVSGRMRSTGVPVKFHHKEVILIASTLMD